MSMISGKHHSRETTRARARNKKQETRNKNSKNKKQEQDRNLFYRINGQIVKISGSCLASLALTCHPMAVGKDENGPIDALRFERHSLDPSRTCGCLPVGSGVLIWGCGTRCRDLRRRGLRISSLVFQVPVASGRRRGRESFAGRGRQFEQVDSNLRSSKDLSRQNGGARRGGQIRRQHERPGLPGPQSG
eukprot:scaffold368_cov258-Pinguiococcus_pyrenoidosus.AAC.45